MKLVASLLSLILLLLPAHAQDEFTRLDNLRLVEHSGNDGDSFMVTDGESTWVLRLYFVDCPESGAEDETMLRRLREQTRYFGLERHADTITYGKKAYQAVQAWLSEPFIAYTTHAGAMGRSSISRIFAFVVTADGRDLDKLLVRQGLARSFGVGRRDYNGIHREDRQAYLEDLEVAAMLSRRGIWSATAPELIAELRATQRSEEQELQRIRRELGLGPLEQGETICLNTASIEELQRLPGIGPALADRIDQARPYENIDDLSIVSGIGPVIISRLRDFLVITYKHPD